MTTHMNCTDQSSSIADEIGNAESGDQLVINTMDKKRKVRDGFLNTSSVQIKEGRKAIGKRQRKRNGLKGDGEENKAKSDKKDKKKVLEEAPTSYIRVRARRGQATDNHSLAERVRREKISGRMKVLQTLVPGCDKVIGKALMLDEIINYVQSLQHQVEFLSMKLASLNPTLYDFGMDVDALMIMPERLNKLVSPILLSNMEKYNSALPVAFVEAATPNTYPQLFPQGHIISPDRENGTADKELPINLAASSFTNLWPFH